MGQWNSVHSAAHSMPDIHCIGSAALWRQKQQGWRQRCAARDLAGCARGPARGHSCACGTAIGTSGLRLSAAVLTAASRFVVGHLMIGEARVIVAIQMIQTRSFAPVGSFKCLRNAAHTRERATRHSHTNIFDAVIFQIESRAASCFQSRKQQNCCRKQSRNRVESMFGKRSRHRLYCTVSPPLITLTFSQ